MGNSFRSRRILSLKIIFWYIVIGFIWLIATDSMISSLPLKDYVRNLIELFFNFLFVLATALLFLYFLNRYLHNLYLSQRALRKSEKRLRILINTIPDFVILKETGGGVLEANQAAHDFFEMNGRNMIGKDVAELEEMSELHNRQYWSFLKNSDQETLHSKSIHRLEEVITRGAEAKTIEITKVPIYHAPDQHENILVIGKDITERKRVEDELRMIKDQLENFISTSADAILFYDIDGTIRRVNNAFEQMYGWTADEIVGMRTRVTVPLECRKESRDLYFKLKNGEQIIGHETVRQRKDGTRFHVSVTFSPIKNRKGEVVSVSGIIRDITERKKSEELLRKSDMLSVIGQMAAGVAHEIRNPLTSLKGFVQLIQLEQSYNPKYINIILSELDRINTIVNEFMVLAKPQVVSFEQRNLNKLVLDVVTILETQAILHNCEIITKFSKQDALLMCEENQLKQVFINVIKNSIEAMPKGGKITITIDQPDEQNISVEVTDEGNGIPAERIKRLGEPFYTTKEKGTGLGLMVSYKIIRAHQGHMDIKSVISRGTTVLITLPINHSE
ncbi:PAS domain-containing sensor histidine kinase [Bacillus horti]|uniref:histidine kinase n=1 Tax=Caldalkalibacillus horti TaxID=77523 RepID=A0ABT9VZD9_9BACI|nr:PAS domain S-box protein [Bacillus horti]MDQ0166360.1 PAS domain S-box-containing protein [Bacillus horti]